MVLALGAREKSGLALTFDPFVWGVVLVLVSPFLIYILVRLIMSSRRERAAAEAKALANRDEAAAHFERIAQGFDSVETNLILKDGEHAIHTGPAVLYETRAYRRYAGAGTSIRGIHVGGGASDSQQALRRIDGGKLTVTTKRLVFDGSTENRSVNLKDILSVERLADGIEVGVERRQKSMIFAVDNPLIWHPMVEAAASGKVAVRETEPTASTPLPSVPSAPRAPAKDLSSLPRVQLGPGADFDHAIVGESNYQGTLRKAAGDRLANGETVVIPCLVVPEPENAYDPNAIAVHLETGGKIGYFSRDDAKAWADVAIDLRKRGAVGQCEGYLRGGTPEKKSIGVWLSLRSPEDVIDKLP